MQDNGDSRFEIKINLIKIQILKYSGQINADDYINTKYKTDEAGEYKVPNKKSEKKLSRSEKINLSLAAVGILATIAFGILALI